MIYDDLKNPYIKISYEFIRNHLACFDKKLEKGLS